MTTYRPASEVGRIARDLIPKWHADLGDTRIEYVFRDKATMSAGKVVWGKARKISGLNAYLTALKVEYDDGQLVISDIANSEDYFVIEIAENVWKLLNDAEREALVDHELSHCAIEVDDDDKVKLGIRGHTVEEFVGVIERHGLWRDDIKLMARAMQQGMLDLYGDDPDGKRDPDAFDDWIDDNCPPATIEESIEADDDEQ